MAQPLSVMRIEEHPSWSFSAPDLALWHGESQTAVVADPHLFYESVRGRRGAAMGHGSLEEATARFKSLERHLAPTRLVVLGDFIDGRLLKNEREMLAKLLSRFGWQWVVAYGNHDRSLLRGSALPGLELVSAVDLAGWTLAHGDHLLPLPAIIGHEHPVAHVEDEVGLRTALPALIVWKDLMILPAFSAWSSGVGVGALMRGSGLSPLLDETHRAISPVVYLAAAGKGYRVPSVDMLKS